TREKNCKISSAHFYERLREQDRSDRALARRRAERRRSRVARRARGRLRGMRRNAPASGNHAANFAERASRRIEPARVAAVLARRAAADQRKRAWHRAALERLRGA